MIPLITLGYMAAAGTVGIVLTPFVVPAALGVVGFGAAGPVAGSIAAATQATLGNVAAGSIFATLQGMAMGAGVPVALQAVGGAVTAGGAMAVAAVVALV